MAAKEAIARLLRPPQERIVLLGDPAMRNYEQREMGSLKCSSKVLHSSPLTNVTIICMLCQKISAFYRIPGL